MSAGSISILTLNLVLTQEIPANVRSGVHIYFTTMHHQASHDFIGSRKCVPMAFTAKSPLCPNIITAVLLLYIPWTRFFPPTYVCTSVENLVYTVQYQMLCFQTYRVRCITAVHYGPVFTPPTYACQRVKNLLYCTISYVVFQNIVVTTVLCRLVFPLPAFVRTRNFLYVRCMENHIKTSMLIVEKKSMLYI